jgi:hypothetical protein
MVEKVLAGIGLVACVALLAWMLLGPARQDRLKRTAQRGLRWRSHRRQARVEAAKAIERARRPVIDRDGNVYRPKSFDRRTKRSRDDA